jgi:hypothetical protein
VTAASTGDVGSDALELVARQRPTSPCQEKLDRLGWVTCEWFEVDGYRFAIRSTSAMFGAWVGETLAHYRSPRQPADHPSDALYSVVAEDEPREEELARRRFSIIYQSGWGIVRTMDLPFLAEQLIRHVDALRAPIRDDAIFLEVGTVVVDGNVCIIPAVLQPAVQKANRRARRAGLVCPGGMHAAIDLDTGDLIPSVIQLRIPPDAFNDARKRFADRADEMTWQPFAPTPVSALLFAGGDGPAHLHPVSRATALRELAPRIRNVRVLGGAAFRGLSRLVAEASCYEGVWHSTDGMLEIMSAAATNPYVAERTQDTLVAR